MITIDLTQPDGAKVTVFAHSIFAISDLMDRVGSVILSTGSSRDLVVFVQETRAEIMNQLEVIEFDVRAKTGNDHNVS
jgi:hypothetical protein